MKKRFTGIIAAALLAGAMAVTAQADGETLTMMLNCTESDSQYPYYKAIIDGFNESNEFGVTIDCVYYQNSDYKNAMNTLMPSDSEPGIIFTWELGYLENYVNGGKIISLQPYLDADPEWAATFNEGVLDLLTYNGEVYGVPTQQSLGVMFYNTRIFEENGVEVPTTWDEFNQVCETLKANGVTPITMASTPQDAWLVSQYIQEISNGIAGYDLFSSLADGTGAWNDPAFVEAAQLYMEQVNNGYFEDGFTGVSGDEAREFMRMGIAAMYFNGSWECAGLGDKEQCAEADNISAFVMPKVNADNTGVTLGSVDTSFAITQNCENVDAAVAFLKYWTNEENTKMLAYESRRLPCLNWELDAAQLSPLAATVLDCMQAQKNVTPWLDRVDADLGNEFNNQCVAISNGDDPQACFDALQAYVDSRQ